MTQHHRDETYAMYADDEEAPLRWDTHTTCERNCAYSKKPEYRPVEPREDLFYMLLKPRLARIS